MTAIELLKTYLNNGDVITTIVVQDRDDNILKFETHDAYNVNIIDIENEMLHLEVSAWWVSELGIVYIYVNDNESLN